MSDGTQQSALSVPNVQRAQLQIMPSRPPDVVMQNLEDAGLPAFLLTYISNSLFVVLLPVAALARRPRAGQQHAAQPASPGKAR